MAEIGRDIDKAGEILKEGGLVAIPTETVYGLAANALDPEAVTGIFEAKERPSFDPLIVHLSLEDPSSRYVEQFPEKSGLLMEQFWPGPLTLVMKKQRIIPDIVTAGLDTVGLRKPDHDLTQKLLGSLEFPLAAPSANLFGKVSPTSPSDVNDQLGDRIDYILDGGPCPVGLESTIVGWPKGTPVIYRMGGTSVEDIQALIGELEVRTTSTSNPSAPGMLISHYAPGTQILTDPPNEEVLENTENGYLRFSEPIPGIDLRRQIILSEHADLGEAARNLFRSLRQVDSMKVTRVYVEFVPDEGLGRAINDRLRRAAGKG